MNNEILKKINNSLFYICIDTKYFTKPKMRKLMTEKTSIFD